MSSADADEMMLQVVQLRACVVLTVAQRKLQQCSPE